MRQRRGEEFWKRALARVEAGEPVAKVAKDLGVPSQSIYWWRARLARTGKGGASSGQMATAEPRFVELAVSPTPEAKMELMVGDTWLSVPVGTSPAYLAAVVRALGESC